MPTRDGGGRVYSTELGRTCPACGQALAACACGARAALAIKGDGKVRVSRDAKGRGGKTVTVVRGLPLEAMALARLGKELRTACGSGGTVKDGVLEIQGDHVARVLEILNQQGWQAKQAGG